MAETKAIKRRIKSVKNTRKITKAMELVAASKMRKAVNQVQGTRPFSRLAWETVRAVSTVTSPETHPLLADHTEAKRALVLLVTSDRGLAGGFNANILKKTATHVKALTELESDFICVGRRGADAMRRANRTVLANFTELANHPRFEETLPVARLLLESYASGRYRRVIVAYTDFVSAITQKPLLIDLLPLKQPTILEHAVGEMETREPVTPYTFEPSPREVLDRLLPRLVETMVYQAILESAASEHSARMMAMRSASDAAADMIDALTFTFNQARQAGITQEIAEISSGKAALEQ